MRRFLILLVAALLLGVISAPLLAQDSAASGVGYIRVSNQTAGTRTIVVFVNGEVRLSGLRFGNTTRWIDLAPGSYEVAISRNGKIEGAFFTTTVEVTEGSFTTIATRGNNDITASVFAESLSDIPEGQARVTVLHGIQGAPPVNVLANGSAVISLLAYPGTVVDLNGKINDGVTSIDVPAGTYDLSVVWGGDPNKTPVIELPGTELAAGMSYFVAAIGTSDAPDVIVNATDPAEFTAATEDAGSGDTASNDSGSSDAGSTDAGSADAGTLGIADIALGNPDFSTLVSAVLAADPSVLETLSGGGEFTVFAPTNEAFAKTLEAMGMTAEDVMGNQELLTQILLYHVIRGKLTSDMLVNGASITTLSGDRIKVTIADGVVTLNGTVTVTQADLLASNGVIHVIDGVLIPPTK